ncbi:MAG: tlcA-B [Francisellaceae bacterium]|nr:tlcA-B [Francisellaceae bacterium]
MESRAFSKWRSLLWPVHYNELGKLLPLLIIKFCISFNYTVLHAIKDTITVTTKGAGAEAIPVLKGGVVIIAAFIFMLIYTKLSNKLTKEKLFYVILSPFLIFFLLYGFILFPNRESLSPTLSADWLLSIIGDNHQHWVSIYRYWMNSLFFIMSELWGGVIISLLFWGFANQINTLNEAARFYTLYSAGGHLGVIAAGGLTYHYSHTLGFSQYESIIKHLMIFVVIAGLVVIGIYRKTSKNYLLNKDSKKINESDFNQKTHLSLKNSLLYIFSSPYLGLIALMVIGYSVSVNLVEVTWKAILHVQYPQAQDYQAFIGIVDSLTGCISFLLALFIGGNIIRKFGWYKSAQLTPIVLGVTSILFFGLYFFANIKIENLNLSFIDSKLLMSIVLIGALHNIACKSMKYCLFDPTKEMAYIPLDNESKVKGKAAVDVVASRLGKSGSSWIQLILIELLGSGSILSIANWLAPIVMVIVFVWIQAIRYLNKRFFSLLDNPKEKNLSKQSFKINYSPKNSVNPI